MKYISTRGLAPAVSFREAVFTGFASDGGLLLPETIPTVTKDVLSSWRSLKFPQLAAAIACQFVDENDIPSSTLQKLFHDAFKVFPIHESGDICPILTLKNGVRIMELFHGPTMAFKDLSMCCVSQLMEYFLHLSGEHVTALVVTSGDTGSSAIESVRNKDNINLIVLLPHGFCSPIQQRMMTTVVADNIHVFSMEGTCDDGDSIMKKVMLDPVINTKYKILTMNSNNWVRIMLQITAYFYAYLNTIGVNEDGGRVRVIVPTGGAGNITAGFIAKLMGLPIDLKSAVNTNDAFFKLLKNGKLVDGLAHKTYACAMDIQRPVNIERVLLLVSGYDFEAIRSLMSTYEETGEGVLPGRILNKLREAIECDSFGNNDIIETIKNTWTSSQYVVCPHTATAMKFALDRPSFGEPVVKNVVFGVASPLKFPEILQIADVIAAVKNTDFIDRLMAMGENFTLLKKSDNWFREIASKIEEMNKKYM